MNEASNMKGKPHVVVLGCNFGGLTAARFIKEKAGDAVNVTVIDRKSYLVFVPNIQMEVFADKDPEEKLQMQFYQLLKSDGSVFLQAEVKAIDIESKSITVIPTERPGAASEKVSYDYLVLALGRKLDYAAIPGLAEY